MDKNQKGEVEVDVQELVEYGLLDLAKLCAVSGEWTTIETVGHYVTTCDDGSMRTIDLHIEVGGACGIEVFRYVEYDEGCGYLDGGIGPLTLDLDEARAQAEEVIQNQDETPDLGEIVEEILATGYFGAEADGAYIASIVEEATRHSQGYLVLPRRVVAGPIGCGWTTSGGLEEPHIQLRATYERAELAADALLKATRAAVAHEDE